MHIFLVRIYISHTYTDLLLMIYRDADRALKIVDGDLDGKIGLVDFIRFATRLKTHYYSHLDDQDQGGEGMGVGQEEEEGEMSG